MIGRALSSSLTLSCSARAFASAPSWRRPGSPIRRGRAAGCRAGRRTSSEPSAFDLEVDQLAFVQFDGAVAVAFALLDEAAAIAAPAFRRGQAGDDVPVGADEPTVIGDPDGQVARDQPPDNIVAELESPSSGKRPGIARTSSASSPSSCQRPVALSSSQGPSGRVSWNSGCPAAVAFWSRT